MEIILKQDVQNLGYKDEIVTVKNGYANNYLLPMGYAIIATPTNKKIHAENLKQQAHKLAAILAAAQKEAEALNGVALAIEAKVSATGALYGSVNAATIAEELAKKGIEVDRKKIIMKDIKAVGSYVATIAFHKEVKVEGPLTVVAEGQEAEVAAPAAEEAPAAEVAE